MSILKKEVSNILTITDKSGRPKFVIFDEDTEPVSIDDKILADSKKDEGENSENSERQHPTD